MVYTCLLYTSRSQNLIKGLGFKDENPIGNVFSNAMNPLTELLAGVYLSLIHISSEPLLKITVDEIEQTILNYCNINEIPKELTLSLIHIYTI